MKLFVKRVLKAVVPFQPQLRAIIGRARAMAPGPFRHSRELQRLTAEVRGVRDLVRNFNDALLESSAVWGRTLQQVRDAIPARGAVSGLDAGDDLRVASIVQALSHLPPESTVLSFGGGSGAVERALSFLGRRVHGVAPWPKLWGEPGIETFSSCDGWASLAAQARGIVVEIDTRGGGSRDMEAAFAVLPFSGLTEGCAPGTTLVAAFVSDASDSARTRLESELRHRSGGWLLREWKTSGDTLDLVTMVHE